MAAWIASFCAARSNCQKPRKIPKPAKNTVARDNKSNLHFEFNCISSFYVLPCQPCFLCYSRQLGSCTFFHAAWQFNGFWKIQTNGPGTCDAGRRVDIFIRLYLDLMEVRADSTDGDSPWRLKSSKTSAHIKMNTPLKKAPSRCLFTERTALKANTPKRKDQATPRQRSASTTRRLQNQNGAPR